MNKAACTILGLRREDLLGMKVVDLHASIAPLDAISGVQQASSEVFFQGRRRRPDGGLLTIGMDNISLDGDATRADVMMPEGEYVLLIVSDTGHGMEGAVLQRIFEPFFTTKEQGKGTGLGLAAVQGIIKQSDGFIFCESAPGKGTTFEVSLPRVRDAERSTRVLEERTGTGEKGTETLLLVEDDESVRRLTSLVLEKAGYAV